jgi:flagellar basal-body rod modification protein FlgD
MTTTNPITAASSATTATTAATTTSATKTLGQSDFLSLLVAQLKNQDPLNPSDPTEFTSQLAQYSQLEQLFNLNTSLATLTTAQSSSEKLSALSLIGQDVVVAGNNFTLKDSPVQIGYKTDGTATSLSVQVQDSTGKTVATLPTNGLSAGNHFLTWDGKDASGNMLTPGTYSIALTAKNSSGAAATVSPLVRTTVTGVDLTASEAQIVTGVGQFKVSAIQDALSSGQSALDSST